MVDDLIPESVKICGRALGLPPNKTVEGFRFYRRRGHTEIWLQFDGGLGVNASLRYEIYPKTVEEARRWAQDFAKTHGFEYAEIKRVRPPKLRLIITPPVKAVQGRLV